MSLIGCSEVHLPLMYVIGGRLLVHCTQGNCSLEVPPIIRDLTVYSNAFISFM